MYFNKKKYLLELVKNYKMQKDGKQEYAATVSAYQEAFIGCYMFGFVSVFLGLLTYHVSVLYSGTTCAWNCDYQ